MKHSCAFKEIIANTKLDYFRCVYQGPQDIDGEEGDGEGDKAHGLQPAAQLEMILSPPQTQPA